MSGKHCRLFIPKFRTQFFNNAPEFYYFDGRINPNPYRLPYDVETKKALRATVLFFPLPDIPGIEAINIYGDATALICFRRMYAGRKWQHICMQEYNVSAFYFPLPI